MTGAEIAECLGMALSTVSAVLKRIGLGKLSRLEPLEPPTATSAVTPASCCTSMSRSSAGSRAAGHRVTGHRGQRNQRKNGNRAVGWEFVHVCVDDATRLAYVEVLCDEKAATAVAFLGRAIAFYAAHGIAVQRVMTDNGAGSSRRSTASPAAPSASVTCALALNAHAPTARPNASSKR